MTDKASNTDILDYTTHIVSAHVSNNKVGVEDLPKLIRDVYSSLARGDHQSEPGRETPTPAVAIKKSVTPDYIICLEDGKKFKMLKRHLKTVYNMTPDQYREKWRLPTDYPMVAPNYAKHRSRVAKEIGLGTQPRQKTAPESKVDKV